MTAPGSNESAPGSKTPDPAPGSKGPGDRPPGSNAPAAEQLYGAAWVYLNRWFKVPVVPPSLPAAGESGQDRFRPHPKFLTYLRAIYWIVFSLIALAVLIFLIILVFNEPIVGMILSPLVLVILGGAGLVHFIALRFRYDATWYVMTDRSLRIRRGIWVIQETTTTFENVQNVKVKQGPLQRYFGIASVIVETAGGGAGSGNKGMQVDNQALIEGIDNPNEIRDRILARLRQSGSAGLGDDSDDQPTRAVATGWSAEHIAALREIRAAIADLRS